MPASKPKKAASNKKRTTKAASKSGASKKSTASRKAKPAKSAAGKAAAKKAAGKKPISGKKPASSAVRKPAAGKAAAGRKATPARNTPAVKSAPKAPKAATKKAPVKKAASKKASTARTAPAPRKAARPAAPARRTPAKRKPRGNGVAVLDQPERRFSFSGPLKSFQPYEPGAREEYMSDGMREHFRLILQTWRQELMEEVDRTVHHMKDEAANFPDPNDRATQESEFGLELRTRDRERKLLKKIDEALMRIEDGTYGYCLETGEEIGLRRLEARPVATLTVEAQERRELAEKQYRDRDDR